MRGISREPAPARLNTGDHPRPEFLALRTVHRRQGWRANFQALTAMREPVVPLVQHASDEARDELARRGAL